MSSFLEYDADIKARLHCVSKNITSQPTCNTCNKILKMRMDGRYRFTFPKTCGPKCFANDSDVIDRRRATNLKKYGSTNYLTSQRGIEKSKTTLLKKHGVTNAARIPNTKNKQSSLNTESE